MRLTSKEKQMLSVLQLNANISLQDLSKILKCREHAARYALEKLRKNGIIQRRPMTDVHRMGFTQYSIFFMPFFQSAGAQTNLLRFLIESSSTSDIFELGGDYRYGVVLTVRDVQEVYIFLSAISKLKGVTIGEKSLSTRISTSLFQRKYLATIPGKTTHFTYRRSEERGALDEVDYKILTVIHLHPDASLREISKSLGMAHTSIAARIKRLEKDKIILGYVYGIASQLFGMEAYRLIVHTKGFDYDSWQRLFKFAAQHPNILCLFQCIGSWDYEFEIEVEDRQQVASIVQQVHEFLEDSVLSIKTLPIFSFPKSTGYPYAKPFTDSQQALYIQ
jgi:DNA-binding Lrp family transcriptional regulator